MEAHYNTAFHSPLWQTQHPITDQNIEINQREAESHLITAVWVYIAGQVLIRLIHLIGNNYYRIETW